MSLFCFPPSVTCVLPPRRWEASLCPSKGGGGGGAAVAQLASASWLQWLSRLSFFLLLFLLCIPALVSLDPSSLPPPSNKSPASEGWDSSCCCLALIWLTISHNAPFSCLPTVKEKYILQVKLVHAGRWTAAASFQVDYSAFAEVCCGNTFIQLFWPLPAAIVSFWPLHLIRAVAFNSCGGRLMPLLIFVHFSLWLLSGIVWVFRVKIR